MITILIFIYEKYCFQGFRVGPNEKKKNQKFIILLNHMYK